LAVVICWPGVGAGEPGLIGHPGNDTWNHAWGFWWVGAEVLEQGRWPDWTGLQAYPRGGALFFIDTFNALLTLPLTAQFGPVAAYNAAVVAGLWMSAMGAWGLARHVTRDSNASLVAGVIYGFSAHLLAQTYNGISETVNAGWLALALWSIVRLLERPTFRRGLLAGALYTVCGISNWYYGLFALLATALLAIHRLVRGSYPTPWFEVFRQGAVGSLPFIPLAVGALWLLARSLGAGDALVGRDPEFVWRSLLDHNMTDIQCFFRPGRFYSPDLSALYGEELIIVTYVGWSALLLAAFAVIRSPRRGVLQPWLLIAVVFWVFSLGPYLFAFGEYVEIAGRRIALPFLAFFKAFPLFSRISHPFRFVVGVQLGVAVLGAYGVHRLIRSRSSSVQRCVGVVASCLVLMETWYFSPAPLPLPRSPAEIPAAYSAVVQAGEAGALLDLPLTVPNLERGVYGWYQTAHQRPSPYALNEPMPGVLASSRLAQVLAQVEAGRARYLPRSLPDLSLVAWARVLGRQGYRYIVVHTGYYTPPKLAQTQLLLSGLFGPPEVVGELLVFRVSP
jgi:hypothetical protein